MVGQKLIDTNYQSKEAKLMVLKQRAEKISLFIRELRYAKNKAYLQIMSGVTGIEALVTLQSFLLQLSLYYRKYKTSLVNDTLEVYRAHEALALYYRNRDLSGVIQYLTEVKNLFSLIKEEEV